MVLESCNLSLALYYVHQFFALHIRYVSDTISSRRKTKNMKKQLIKKLIAPIGKGILVFAIFGLALYAYAAITYPPEPGPVTGVVGQFAGLSAPSDGSSGGYAGANTICDTAFTGSHVCTAMEVMNTYNHNPSFLTGATGQAWINNGPPGHHETLSNDCQGWTLDLPVEASYGRYGSVWHFTSHKSLIQFCNESIPFACCK